MQINGLHRIPIKSDSLTWFFLCVLHLPVCVLERCHSVYHYEDLEPEKLLNLNIVNLEMLSNVTKGNRLTNRAQQLIVSGIYWEWQRVFLRRVMAHKKAAWRVMELVWNVSRLLPLTHRVRGRGRLTFQTSSITRHAAFFWAITRRKKTLCHSQ